MASLYCEHDRLADACEHCLAQAAGFKDAFDGPAARLPGQAAVEASANAPAPKKKKAARKRT
jgi:hypothetical protein